MVKEIVLFQSLSGSRDPKVVFNKYDKINDVSPVQTFQRRT